MCKTFVYLLADRNTMLSCNWSISFIASAEQKEQGTAKATFGAVTADAAAEAGLSALAALLNAAVPASGQALLNLLDRLMRVAALPRANACEEVRAVSPLQVPLF